MPFQTHRPTQTLLIPQKRPLLAPVKPTINVVQHQHQHQHQHQTSPENSLPNTTTTITTITPQKEERKEEEEELQPTEYDFARIPQPFLDPRLWENIKSVDSLYSSSLSASSSSIRERRGMNEKEAEEEDRRKRAREAEYGGMAVRGRSGVRGRRDR